jgi:hypothetical protein
MNYIPFHKSVTQEYVRDTIHNNGKDASELQGYLLIPWIYNITSNRTYFE